jgi:hypothetical protein
MPDQPLKSAYELAMERLRTQDRKAGREEQSPLTDEQKQEIARLRQEAKAKVAEIEILYQDAIQGSAEKPEELAKIQDRHLIDRERIDSRLESAIAKVRAK